MDTRALGAASLARRREAQDATVVLIREQVDRAVRTLPHVADAPAELVQHALLAHRPVVLQLQAGHELEFQRAVEQAVLPGWHEIAGVEGHARRRDRGRPVPHRIDHAFGVLFAGADRRAVVIDAEADDRPAIIAALLDNVDLVAAHVGPCSCSQSSLVHGLNASPSALRTPYAQISGSSFCLPTNGLSDGAFPSGVMRMILPTLFDRFCDSSALK